MTALVAASLPLKTTSKTQNPCREITLNCPVYRYRFGEFEISSASSHSPAVLMRLFDCYFEKYVRRDDTFSTALPTSGFFDVIRRSPNATVGHMIPYRLLSVGRGFPYDDGTAVYEINDGARYAKYEINVPLTRRAPHVAVEVARKVYGIESPEDWEDTVRRVSTLLETR